MPRHTDVVKFEKNYFAVRIRRVTISSKTTDAIVRGDGTCRLNRIVDVKKTIDRKLRIKGDAEEAVRPVSSCKNITSRFYKASSG